MKTQIFALACCLAISCGKKHENATSAAPVSTVEKGKDIFENAGNCAACHKGDNDVLAPSLPAIAAAYKKADMVAFLKGKSGPVVDPSRYEIMKTNFSVTESMSDDDLKAIEAYIATFVK